MKSFYLILFLLASFPSFISSAKNKKKSLKGTTEIPETTAEQPAIIAIEIVDPNENSTSKNSKRTIETALGYGYNSYENPRYEVYKYSQHDIPPYNAAPNNVFTSVQTTPVTVQKSVQYSIPTITETAPNALKPGTTLYSSLGTKGQVGSLTSSLEQVPGLEHNQNPLPVIVLRIYPDQLKDSTIQANLPESHPFAKTINSINIQSLLVHYIKALQNQNHVAGAANYYETPQNTYDGSSQYYSAPVYSSTTQRPISYSTKNPVSSAYYLPSNSNRQKSKYRSNSQYYQPNQYQYQQHSADSVQVQEAPIKYEFKYESPVPQKHSAKKPQYYYVQPNSESSYSTEPSQYYQASQQYDYRPQQLLQANAPQVQQYYTADDAQYENYYHGGAQQQQYVPKKQKFLTTENYPTEKHTRVIFRSNSGKIRTPEPEEQAGAKEIKTIKIQVPDNIAKVEVQESEKPYYPQNYLEQQQQQVDQYSDSEQTYSNSDGYGYSTENTVVPNVYGAPDISRDDSFNYQNIDYEQMAKYFARRGAMPNYFYQSSEDVEERERTATSTEDVKAYESVAFSSTAEPPVERKVKTKKHKVR